MLFAKIFLHGHLVHLFAVTHMLLFKCLICLSSSCCHPFSTHCWISQLTCPSLKAWFAQTLAVPVKNLGCQSHWQQKTYFLAPILVDILEFASSYTCQAQGAANSSCPLLSSCNYAPNAVVKPQPRAGHQSRWSRGCSARWAGNPLWARLYFLMLIPRYLTRVSFLSSEWFLLSLV